MDELVAAARHVLEQYANNTVEADHGRLKARLRPMRGLQTLWSLRTAAAGHACVQNPRRRHYEITVDARIHDVHDHRHRNTLNLPRPDRGSATAYPSFSRAWLAPRPPHRRVCWSALLPIRARPAV
jgi:hypothetical protein